MVLLELYLGETAMPTLTKTEAKVVSGEILTFLSSEMGELQKKGLAGKPRFRVSYTPPTESKFRTGLPVFDKGLAHSPLSVPFKVEVDYGETLPVYWKLFLILDFSCADLDTTPFSQRVVCKEHFEISFPEFETFREALRDFARRMFGVTRVEFIKERV